jgi:hypothetical protein
MAEGVSGIPNASHSNPGSAFCMALPSLTKTTSQGEEK